MVVCLVGVGGALPAQATTPDGYFIAKAYEDFVFIPPTPSQAANWETYLQANSREAMVTSLVSTSDFQMLWVQYVNFKYTGIDFISGSHIATLHNNLAASGNYLQTEIDVLASQTYYDQIGATDADFVTQLILDVWQRPPTPAEQTWYTSNVPNWGRSGTAFIVLVNVAASQARIAGSPGQPNCPTVAFDSTIAAEAGASCIFLDRPATSAEITSWTSQMAPNGYNLPLIWAKMAGTTEYFNLAQP